MFCDLKATAQLAEHLHHFIPSIQPSLECVTQLAITIPPAPCFGNYIAHDVEAAFQARIAMLLPSANAFPHLQRLILDKAGNVNLLKCFGSSCSKLTHLECDFQTLVCSIGEQPLISLLPHLTSLSTLVSPQVCPARNSGAYQRTVAEKRRHDDTCQVLRMCAGLLFVDTGSVPMAPDIWQELPSSLKSLRCANPLNRFHTNWSGHASMTHLELGGDDALEIVIKQLASLLSALPNLTDLQLSRSQPVEAECLQADALALQKVDKLMTSGSLVITHVQSRKKSCPIRLYASVNKIRLRISVDPTGQHVNARGGLDPYSADSIGFLDQIEPLLGFAIVEFGQINSYKPVALRLSQLPRVFPNLEELSITFLIISGSDLLALAECNSLKALSLIRIDGVDVKDVQALCEASSSLHVVRLIGRGTFQMKKDLSEEQHDEIWGMHVHVLFLHSVPTEDV